MDDARLLYVILSALDTTRNVIKQRDEDSNWVYGVMVTPDEIEEAKALIGERFTEGKALAGSSAPLEKVAAMAFGVIRSAIDSEEAFPYESMVGAADMLYQVLWPEQSALKKLEQKKS